MALGPILVMLATSLKTRNQIFGDTASFFFMPTLMNYQAVLEDPANVRFLTNSLIVAIVSTAITLTLGCMAAYAIVRFRFMGRDAASLARCSCAWCAAGCALRSGLHHLDLPVRAHQHAHGVILVYTAINLPFVIWICRASSCRLPRPLEEAARIDGREPLSGLLLVVCCRSSSRGWPRRRSSPSA